MLDLTNHTQPSPWRRGVMPGEQPLYAGRFTRPARDERLLAIPVTGRWRDANRCKGIWPRPSAC